ncbi:hypothetical protein BDW60DRAFT_30847 [Aspergillus nidulans var. acristatus]
MVASGIPISNVITRLHFNQQGKILRDNRRRRYLKKLDLEYLVFLGHDIISSIAVAGDLVIMFSHHVLADEQFLLCRVGLAKNN